MAFVGIANQIIDPLDAFSVHVLDGVATSATHANHFDFGGVFFRSIIGRHKFYLIHIYIILLSVNGWFFTKFGQRCVP